MDRHEVAFARAMRAYERGRFVRALVVSTPAMLVALGVSAAGRPPVLAALLVLVSVTLLWVGRGWARGWLPGFLSGVLPFLAPYGSHSSFVCSTTSCSTLCVAACTAAGVVAGFIIGLTGRHELTRVAGAAITAVVVGSLGCAHLGVSAVLGMAIATLLASTGSALLLRPRAA